MSIRSGLLVNSASGLVERFLNLSVQIWLYQYLIKRISPVEYSLYPVVTALMVFVPPFMVVLTAGLVRDTVEAHARKDDQRVTEITSTMFPVLFAGGVGLALLALVVAKFVGSILNIAPERVSEARVMVALLFGSLSLRLILIPFGVGLYVRQKFVVTNTLNMLQTVIRVLLLFILLLGAGPRVLWVVVASVVADVAVVIATTILSVRALPVLKFRFEAVRWELLSSLMTFGLWNMIGSIGVLIRRSSDLLILNRFATPIDVNTFHLGSLTDNQIDAALDKVKEPLVPHVIALTATGSPRALQTISIKGACYGMWAVFLVATPLIVFRQQLWSLYLGSELQVYADVPFVMVLLLARYWIEGPMSMVGLAAYAMNRMRWLSILVIASSIFNVLITVYFVHVLHMGAVGSALGTLISLLIWVPFPMGKFALDLLGLKLGAWLKVEVWRAVLPSIVAGLFGLGWRYLLHPHTAPELFFAVTTVATVYLMVILIFCLDPNEHRQLKYLFAKLSWQKAL